MSQILTTALFALVGAFIGAYFTRQAQHHKWLLERRAETFAKFLQTIDDARSKASDILYDKTLKNPERDIKILEVYTPALNYARIVKLYLPKSLRKEFYDNAKAYWALHTNPDLGDQRLNKMDDHLNQIQEIFEQELSAYFWLFPILRRLRRLTNHSKLFCYVLAVILLIPLLSDAKTIDVQIKGIDDGVKTSKQQDYRLRGRGLGDVLQFISLYRQ